MDYRRILGYLYGLESPRIKLGLERVQALLDKIGNPEKSLKCIHVAGTNGKGSVCAMIQSVLMKAGYKAGMYTSPHLKRFNERIRINETLISDREIVEYFLRVKPHIKGQSFFEITTAMAFLYFYEKEADFVVLEVGLGGRLDATNVVTPLISVITNIGLEHIELLGNTPEKIAFEKAGIIKGKVPVVTGAKGNSLKVIKKITKEKNAPLVKAKKYPDVKFNHLNGQFQQFNKNIALTTIDTLKKYHDIGLSDKQILNGLQETKWPGRMEFISKNVLVDAAHNADGFKVLKNELLILKKEKNIKNIVFVIGIQADKDIANMLKIISPLASDILFTKSENPKAAEPKYLYGLFNKLNKNRKNEARVISNPKTALKYAKKIAGKNDLIVVAGSIYLVGGLA